MKVEFDRLPDSVRITETFEPEKMSPEEMQRAGWQAILNNFKKFIEVNMRFGWLLTSFLKLGPEDIGGLILLMSSSLTSEFNLSIFADEYNIPFQIYT